MVLPGWALPEESDSVSGTGDGVGVGDGVAVGRGVGVGVGDGVAVGVGEGVAKAMVMLPPDPPDGITSASTEEASVFTTLIAMFPLGALDETKNVAVAIAPAPMVLVEPSRHARQRSTPDPIDVQVISFPAATAAAPGTTFTASMRAES
jgi:hypothetical protein